MKPVKLTFFLSLLLVCASLYSQNEAKHWLVGDTGLQFKDDTVIIVRDYAVHKPAGIGIISSKQGDLLFYSDGLSVWNKHHVLMPNGTNLISEEEEVMRTENLVVPNPGFDSIYYIFTVEPHNGDESSGLYYSVVDISKNNGLGDVTAKGIKILNKTSNKITAVYHQNGKDIWVITHLFGTNSYYSYLITAAGISESPVVSNVGMVITSSFDGQLKASPDGKKIACSYFEMPQIPEDLDLFDFNAETGELYNPMSFTLPVSWGATDGLEFSPDATKLFVTHGGSIQEHGIYQFDLSAGSFEEINNSRVNINMELHNSYEIMQLAPDGKIYISKGGGGGGTQHLGVIENPNEYGENCIVHENGLYLDGGSSFVARTPHFIQNYFYKTSFTFDSNCQAADIQFYLTNSHKIDSVRWYFGEGSTSSLYYPVFNYGISGDYTVSLLAYISGKCDTITKQIRINPYTPIELGNDTTVCYGEKIMVKEKFNSYLWSSGDTVNYKHIEQEGLYKTTVTNQFGCRFSDSVYVSVNDLPVIDLPDTLIFEGLDSIRIDAGEFNSYEWSTGETSDFIYAKEEGWYSVKVENEAGCHSSNSVLVLRQLSEENENDESWKIVNPLPSYLPGLDVHFLNVKTGFIINNKNLLKTTDSGANWEVVMSLSSANRMAFKNSIGYIIGNGGIIYKSTHDGMGWNRLSTPFQDHLTALSLVSEDTIRLTSSNKLFSSNNGGLTWEIHLIEGVTVNDSWFTSAMVGHAVCNSGTILKTTDGGRSWRKTLTSNVSPSNFFRVVFVNDTLGFASREHNDVLRTTDGGESWQRIAGLDAVYDMHFLDELTGYLSGEDGIIYKTADGGKTWQYISPSGRTYAYDIYGIFFVNENEGYATGARGRILKTTDGGATWKEYALTYKDINQLIFVSDSIAYIREGNLLYKTTDGGKTIANMGAPVPGQTIKLLYFVSELTGYFVKSTNHGKNVYKTIDGGLSWKIMNDFNYDMSDINCLYFINEDTGFVSAKFGISRIMKTTDGGITWEKKAENISFSRIQFLDAKTGYASNAYSYYRRMYKTTDGGETWKVILETENLAGFDFIDEFTGYCISDNGFMYKTADGGINWEKLEVPYHYYKFIKFISKNVGFIVDDYGRLYKTMNGGADWKLWTEVYGINAAEIQSDKIFIYGTYGKILENTISVDSVSVYVNPADSVTNVSAVISGMVASNGETVDSLFFEYYGNYLSLTRVGLGKSIDYDSSAAVSVRLSNLKSNSIYYYRLCAVQNGRIYYSDLNSFTTLNDYDIRLMYGFASSSHEAGLMATITSRDADITNIVFEYSTDQSFENSIDAEPNIVLTGNSSDAVAQLTSLLPNTRYYVRLKVSYKDQNIYSNIISFLTLPEYLLHLYTPAIKENNVTIQGNLAAYKDTVTGIGIQYGKSRPYNNDVVMDPFTIYKGDQKIFELPINDLDSNTVYFYRVVFIMGGDTIFGEEKIINCNRELDMVVLDAIQLSDSSVIVKALINSYGRFLNYIKFIYGVDGDYQDSIIATPAYVGSYNTVMVQTVIKGIIPGSEYSLKLSATDQGRKVYSEKFSFSIEGVTRAVDNQMFPYVKVYPNPAVDFIRIEAGYPVSLVELYDNYGRKLMQSTIHQLDVSGLAPGIYFTKVYSGKKAVIVKFIKK